MGTNFKLAASKVSSLLALHTDSLPQLSVEDLRNIMADRWIVLTPHLANQLLALAAHGGEPAIIALTTLDNLIATNKMFDVAFEPMKQALHKMQNDQMHDHDTKQLVADVLEEIAKAQSNFLHSMHKTSYLEAIRHFLHDYPAMTPSDKLRLFPQLEQVWTTHPEHADIVVVTPIVLDALNTASDPALSIAALNVIAASIKARPELAFEIIYIKPPSKEKMQISEDRTRAIADILPLTASCRRPINIPGSLYSLMLGLRPA